MASAASRFLPLESSLDEFIEGQANKNTVSKTNRDVSLLKDFLRAKEMDNEIESLEPIRSSMMYCIHAYWRLKRRTTENTSQQLEGLSFLASTAFYGPRKSYPTTIIDGQQFTKNREILIAKEKELKKAGKENKPKADRALSDGEVHILYSKNLLGLSIPDFLLNTLWLNNTQYFGLRGCQEHRYMKWGDVQLKTTADGVGFLEYNERQTKTRTGTEPKDIRAVKPKMSSVPGSDIDPLKAFHLYASKRPEQMESDDSPFYLAINYTILANSSKPWYKAAPMGSNKLSSLMVEKAGLTAENLTSHSARKRMIQKLND